MRENAPSEIEEANASEATGATSGDAHAPRKKGLKKKIGIVAGVLCVVMIVAGVGFTVWHEQPGFCNAICHTPMDGYLPTYEATPNEPGIDKWGNEVKNSSAMLAPVHRAMNDTSCLGCHEPTLSEQVSEGMKWLTGDYSTVTTQTGMRVPTEKTLEELTAARGVEPETFCLNSSCHNMTREQLAEATKDLERNPHDSPHSQELCGTCHKAHRASVNYCSKCHADAPLPDGWLNAIESDKLMKGLEAA